MSEDKKNDAININHKEFMEGWEEAADMITQARKIVDGKIKKLEESIQRLGEAAPKTSALYSQQLSGLKAQQQTLESEKQNQDNCYPLTPSRQPYKYGSVDHTIQKIGDRIHDSNAHMEFQNDLVKLGHRYADITAENYDLSRQDREMISSLLGKDAPQPETPAATSKGNIFTRMLGAKAKPAPYEISTREELVALNRKLHAAIGIKAAGFGIAINDGYPIVTEQLTAKLWEARRAQTTLEAMASLPQVDELERADLQAFTENNTPYKLEKLLEKINWCNDFVRKELLPESPQERRILAAYNALCGPYRDYSIFDPFSKPTPPPVVHYANNLLIEAGIALNDGNTEASINKERMANLISPDGTVRQNEIEAIKAEMDAKMLTPKEERDYDDSNPTKVQQVTQVRTPWSERFSAARSLADEITATQAAAKSKSK